MNHREFFNQMAPHWDEQVRHDACKLSRIVTALSLQPGERVLDIGTGTGVMLPYLRQALGMLGEITAVDVAEEMLARARAKHSELALFLQADAALLPQTENSVDAILCYSVFPHFEQPQTVLREFARVLRSGGRLVVAHGESRAAINALHEGLETVGQDRLPEAAVLCAWGEEAGFEVEVAVDDEELFVLCFRKK